MVPLFWQDFFPLDLKAGLGTNNEKKKKKTKERKKKKSQTSQSLSEDVPRRPQGCTIFHSHLCYLSPRKLLGTVPLARQGPFLGVTQGVFKAWGWAGCSLRIQARLSLFLPEFSFCGSSLVRTAQHTWQ